MSSDSQSLASLSDLGRVGGLSYIRAEGSGLAIGAMTTYYDIITSEAVQANAPVLAEAAATVADPQVRNMGTIGEASPTQTPPPTCPPSCSRSEPSW